MNRATTLAGERTALAWSRSGLSVVVAAGAALRFGIVGDRLVLGLAVCTLLLAAAGVTQLYVARRYRALREGAPDDMAARRQAFRVMTATALLAAAGALVLLSA